MVNVRVVALTTATVAVQSGSVPPLAGQFPPGVAEVIVLARLLLPVSGLFTVTEKVTVAVPPGDRFPVHDSTGEANDTDPPVAAASPL